MKYEESTNNPSSVLVLDDDAIFRSLLVTILGSVGVNVLEARSMSEADILLRDKKPALAIVDYRMPGGDGMTWIAKVRESGNQMPIVFLSGTWCDVKTFNRLRSILRVSLILQKPIVPELFLDQLEGLLPRWIPQLEQQNEVPVRSSNERSSRGDSSSSLVVSLDREDGGSLPNDFGSENEIGQNVQQSVAQMPASQEPVARSSSSLTPGNYGLVGSGSEASRIPESYAKDAMRMSNTRLPAFGKAPGRSTREQEIPSELNNDLPGRDRPESEDPELADQLVAFRQKLDVERALTVARAEYAKSLPEKVAEFAQSIAELKVDPRNTTRLEESVQHAHRFKGTAGSLGFPEIGKSAGTIEQLLLQGGVHDTTVDSKTWQRIENGLKLCAEIAESAASQGHAATASKASMYWQRVLFVGPLETFSAASKELTESEIAETHLEKSFDTVSGVCAEQRFDCAIIDMNSFGQEQPLVAIAKARQQTFFRLLPLAFISADDELPEESELLYMGAEFGFPADPSVSTIKAAVEGLLSMSNIGKPKVLTVDDDVVLTGFITGTLMSQGFAVKSLSDPIRVLETLEEFEPDLILLDAVMPGLSGYDVCRLLRSLERWQRLPILFLTSKSSPEGRAAAFRAGGDDILAKPILTEELLSRVRSRLELSSHLKQRAGTDSSTGLLTRAAFENSLTVHLEHAKTVGAAFSLALLGLDAFADIALSNGFATQEKLFKDLANLLQARFRLGDLRAHWSEGSFGLAVMNVDADVLSLAINTLQEEFRNRGATEDEALARKRKIRFGVAELIEDGVTAETLLECAYQRMMV
jgi:PleD family two-component response regulator/HPt (histidine-containing phosphotransfer) domain-containing protein